ncbi:MAG: PglZ domain-containing protein [Planctomycetota bacterium]
MPNITNQLRGLGLLSFDPEPLEPLVESVLARWEREPKWRHQIIVHAEESLQSSDLDRIVALLDLRSADDAIDALLRADTPAMLFALGTHFFHLAFDAKRLKQFTPIWAQRRPSILSSLADTPFSEWTMALSHLFDELAVIDQRRGQALPSPASLPRLLDWYIEGGFYDLEYAHARAHHHTLGLPDGKLRKRVDAYLRMLRKKVHQYLDSLDRALADLIVGDWRGYLSSPRLSTRVLWDTVIQKRLSPTPDACLWIVVFDGMRWDTWVRHVKPRLLERFELAMPEKAYLCLLPSWTGIARTGLLAGKVPEGWKNYDNRYTRNQEQLVSRLFDLPQRDRRRSLRFYSGMESERQYGQLDESKRLPYNVLVYNVSDDNIHHQRNDLVVLNEQVDVTLDHVFQVLDRLVGEDDMVVVSSDHGFVELTKGNETVIEDDTRWERYVSGGSHPVRHRYVTTHDLPDDLDTRYKVSYPRYRDQYTVAVGRTWFKRAGWRGPVDRYAHGGLSFAEMVVPGALLRPIVEPRIELTIQTKPHALELNEGDTATLTVYVTNTGNVRVSGRLEVVCNTVAEAASYAVELRPGDRQDYPYEVEAIYHRRSDGTEIETRSVDVSLRYQDLDGQEKISSERAPVAVQARKDVVEIDFGGLDDLDI